MCRSPNPRILYVDDDKDSCEMIGLMLSLVNDNYQITAVSDPLKAMVLLENEPVSLLILDYALPDMTGVELCRQIRQTDSQMPILFFSAMAREIDKEKAFKAGATEYLVKPDDVEKFTETVERLLNEAKSISKSGFH